MRCTVSDNDLNHCWYLMTPLLGSLEALQKVRLNYFSQAWAWYSQAKRSLKSDSQAKIAVCSNTHRSQSDFKERISNLLFFFSAHSFEETIKGYSFDFLSSFEWFIEANSSSHSVLCICFPIVKTRLSDGSAFITYASYVEFLYYSPSSKNRIYLSSWLQVWFIFKISSNINRTKLLLSLNTSSI